MGKVRLPESGSVYVDTQVLIYSVEKHPIYAPMLRPLWTAVEEQRIEAHSSELVLLETLVLPIRNHDVRLISDYNELFVQSGIQLHPVTREILLGAAHLRAAATCIRTPDALHAATARLMHCDVFLTNDTALRQLPGVSSLLLSDIE